MAIKWRPVARVIAFLDVIFLITSIVVLILTVSLVECTPENVVVDATDVKANLLRTWNHFAPLATIALGSGLFFIQLWHSPSLIEGTKNGADNTSALKYSRNWWNSNILLIIFTLFVISIFLLQQMWYVVWLTIFRQALIFVVNFFIAELEVIASEAEAVRVDPPPSYDMIAYFERNFHGSIIDTGPPPYTSIGIE